MTIEIKCLICGCPLLLDIQGENGESVMVEREDCPRCGERIKETQIDDARAEYVDAQQLT